MTNIQGAERKLRQAMFFLSHLQEASSPSRSRTLTSEEHLEYYFSACLSAAQSVYYVLEETGGPAFRTTQKRWRAQILEPERSWFGRMMGLRGDDVHRAVTPTEPLPKYAVEEDSGHHNRSPYYQPQVFQNPALFGRPQVIEMKNPDGTTVRGTSLRGGVGLYMERHGRLVEATEVCSEFIQRLSSLLEAVKAAAPETAS
ncbi:MAG: hypothetical protein ACRD1P_09605 [Thermoanaerobaculia bacterium]